MFEMATPRTFAILLSERARVTEGLEALAKRAERKGLPRLSWTFGRPYTVKGTFGQKEVTIDRVDLRIEGDAPRFAGWTFAAALQHLDGQNVIRSVPGSDALPTEYRTRGPMCDHCRMMRRRNDTYVLRHEDGRTIQVGSSCIGDFLGSADAAKLAAAAEILAIAGEIAESGAESSGEGSGPWVGRLASFLAVVAHSVRTAGWISRTQAQNSYEPIVSTADESIFVASSHLPRAVERRAEITQADRDEGERAAAWAESLTDEQVNDATGDYLHNVRVIGREGLVTRRTAGIAASIVPAYQRAQGVAVNGPRKRLPSTVHVGTIGKRETFQKVCLERVHQYETPYGITTLYVFSRDDGAAIVWRASRPATDDKGFDIGRAHEGACFTLVGTVKEHGEYRGEAQTIVQRCKISQSA